MASSIPKAFVYAPDLIKNFLELIKSYHDNKEIIKVFNKYDQYYMSLNKKDKSLKKLLNTMMMTINTI